jgi:hypothetical protein
MGALNTFSRYGPWKMNINKYNPLDDVPFQQAPSTIIDGYNEALSTTIVLLLFVEVEEKISTSQVGN